MPVVMAIDQMRSGSRASGFPGQMRFALMLRR
jgi:hypothetical protein